MAESGVMTHQRLGIEEIPELDHHEGGEEHGQLMHIYSTLASTLAVNQQGKHHEEEDDAAEQNAETDASIDIIKNQMTQQAVRIRIAQRNVDNAMKKLTEAVQDRKIHEKLKEKAFEQFKLDINAQEMKEIDETVSFKYNNKDE